MIDYPFRDKNSPQVSHFLCSISRFSHPLTTPKTTSEALHNHRRGNERYLYLPALPFLPSLQLFLRLFLSTQQQSYRALLNVLFILSTLTHLNTVTVVVVVSWQPPPIASGKTEVALSERTHHDPNQRRRRRRLRSFKREPLLSIPRANFEVSTSYRNLLLDNSSQLEEIQCTQCVGLLFSS